jgi:hypothetical protein
MCNQIVAKQSLKCNKYFTEMKPPQQGGGSVKERQEMRTIHCALIAAALVASAPAIARDRLGYQAIQAGDLLKAERILVAERQFNPGMPEVMLNLAYVYRHTGRTSEARALYRQVLDQPEIMLDSVQPTMTGVSSYAVARTALQETTLASR